MCWHFLTLTAAGEFKRNRKDGKGIFTWPTGNVYKGEFSSEKMCGKGEMTYTTGHRWKSG